MFNPKNFLCCLVAIASSTASYATQWTVSNSAQAPAQFTSLQAAVDSASAGDTLLVTGTGVTYGDAIIDKALVLIGTGYTPTSAATIVHELDIRSSDVFVSGFWSDPSQGPYLGIRLNAFNAAGQVLSNVHVTRSLTRLQLRGATNTGTGLFQDVHVSECILRGVAFSESIWNQNRFTFDTLIFENNILPGFSPAAGGNQEFLGTQTIILDHNDFLGQSNGWGAFWTQYIATEGWPEAQMIVSNNIFRGTGPRGCPNCCFINNMSFGAGPEDNDTIVVVACDTVNFWGIDPGIPGGQFNVGNDYTLPIGSPALLAASDGTDIGITGGLFPLTVGAPPPGPKVDYVNVDEVAVPPDSLFHYEVLGHAFETPGIQLDSLEYLFDTDGGIGTGTTVEFPPTTILDLIAEAYALGLDSGAHTFGVRVRDQSGMWSASKWTALDVCNTYGPYADFTIYRSGRSVSIADHSANATTIEYDYGDGQSGTDWNPFHTYTEAGLYSVAQIVSGPCGVDTAYRVASISGLSAYQPTKAANEGFCTIALNGAGFTGAMDIRLKRTGSSDLIPLSVVVVSGSSAFAEFDLTAALAEWWNMELTIPGDTTQFIVNAFEIVQPAPRQQIVCTVTGPPVVRSSTWTTFNVDVHNPNGNDVFAVPVWVTFPDDLDYEFITPVEIPVFPGSDTLAADIHVDSLWSEPYSGTAHPLVISRIPAFSTVPISFRAFTTASNGAGDILTWAERPLFGTTGVAAGLDEPGAPGPGAGSSWDCANCFLGLLPGWGCGTSIGGWINHYLPWSQYDGPGPRVSSWREGLRKTIEGCADDVISVAVRESKILDYLHGLKGHAGFGDCIAQKCLPPLAGPKRVSYGCACDPNDKYGPLGISTLGYVSGKEDMSYIIAFENLAGSLFAAQRIVIIDTLDAAVFELHAASLGSIGLADSTLYDGVGAQHMSEVIPLGSGYDLRVNTEIDTTSGIVQWEFFMVDPADLSTPIDPLVGFLPPNNSSPEGQGFVTLRLPLKEGLPHNQVVTNEATIVFDNNEAISTGVWLNTLDTMRPESNVVLLTTSDSIVVVTVDGSDDGSGVEWYEIYVSADTSAGYALWTVTDSTAASFIGEDGLTYHFYSVAIDSVGNREMKADTSEAQATIDFSTSISSIGPDGRVALYPNPTTGSVTLIGSTQSPCLLELEIRNMVGQVLQRRTFPTAPGRIQMTVDLENLADGTYIASIRCEEIMLVERLIRVGK